MTQTEILELFRQQASLLAPESQVPTLNNIIVELAKLLAESRGKLPKENFDSLVHIGSVLYREGNSRYEAHTDMDAIMKHSLKR